MVFLDILSTKLRLSLLKLLVFLFKQSLLLFELLAVMTDCSVVDLEVAHRHQGSQQGLYNLWPPLQYGETVNSCLKLEMFLLSDPL